MIWLLFLTNIKKYYDIKSFIWKYQNSNLEIFRPVEECNDLIYSNAEFLSIGGKYVIISIIIINIYIYLFIIIIIL